VLLEYVCFDIMFFSTYAIIPRDELSKSLEYKSYPLRANSLRLVCHLFLCLTSVIAIIEGLYWKELVLKFSLFILFVENQHLYIESKIIDVKQIGYFVYYFY